MTGIPGASAEAASIHAAFAEDVVYTGAGLSGDAIPAVEIDNPAGSFTGPGASLREKVFEIRYAALPVAPDKTNSLVDGDGATWKVIEVVKRDDVDAYHLYVEAA